MSTNVPATKKPTVDNIMVNMFKISSDVTLKVIDLLILDLQVSSELGHLQVLGEGLDLHHLVFISV